MCRGGGVNYIFKKESIKTNNWESYDYIRSFFPIKDKAYSDKGGGTYRLENYKNGEITTIKGGGGPKRGTREEWPPLRRRGSLNGEKLCRGGGV